MNLVGVAISLLVLWLFVDMYRDISMTLIQYGQQPAPMDWLSVGLLIMLINTPIVSYSASNVATHIAYARAPKPPAKQ